MIQLGSDKVVVFRLKQQEDEFGRQREEYEREVKHLRLLLKERDDQLVLATGEKK